MSEMRSARMQVPPRLMPDNLGRDIVIAALITIIFVASQLQAASRERGCTNIRNAFVTVCHQTLTRL